MPDISETDNTRARALESEAEGLSSTRQASLSGTDRTPAPPEAAPPPKEIARQVMDIVREKLAGDQSSAQQSGIKQPAAHFQDPIPARMLNEFVYCARLFYYEFVEGVFVESADTQRGTNLHQRVDTGSGSLPPASSSDPQLSTGQHPLPLRLHGLRSLRRHCQNGLGRSPAEHERR